LLEIRDWVLFPSDATTTVSPTHASETTTAAKLGDTKKLAKKLRKKNAGRRTLSGDLNGKDSMRRRLGRNNERTTRVKEEGEAVTPGMSRPSQLQIALVSSILTYYYLPSHMHFDYALTDWSSST